MTTIIEKELKILEIDPIQVQESLLALGATKNFEGNVHDIYYDTPESDLSAQSKRIRIRRKGSYHLITMKERIPSTGIKSAHETEIIVENPEQVDQLLQSYGLKPSREKTKHRISYSLNGVTFDIDMYKNIPPILEIEAGDKKTINQWVRKLGLEKKTSATFGAHGLFKHYNLLPTSLVDSQVQKH
ncbi:class IV adenylate cyclase [Patescibacteria group bacterium]|nr:class IV adenylate cyclase [Patescibacteria group bacterium]